VVIEKIYCKKAAGHVFTKLVQMEGNSSTIESLCRRYFPHQPRPAVGPNQPPLQRYRVFPGVNSGRSVTLTTPPCSAVVKKEKNYTSTLEMAHTACTEPQCLYKST
jgi:hypothetical protein